MAQTRFRHLIPWAKAGLSDQASNGSSGNGSASGAGGDAQPEVVYVQTDRHTRRRERLLAAESHRDVARIRAESVREVARIKAEADREVARIKAEKEGEIRLTRWIIGGLIAVGVETPALLWALGHYASGKWMNSHMIELGVAPIVTIPSAYLLSKLARMLWPSATGKGDKQLPSGDPPRQLGP